MEKKRKPFYWIFIKSFTDMHSYKDYLTKSAARPFLYAVLLCLVLSLAFSSYYIASTDSYITDITDQLKANTPEFSIIDGAVSVTNEDPVILADTGSKDTLIVLDTKYFGSPTAYEEYETVVVLGPTDVYLSNSSISYSIPYTSLFGTDADVAASDFINSIISAKSLMYVFIGVMLFFTFLFNYILYTLLISLFVSTGRRITRRTTDMRTLFQLTCYAMTLPSILYTAWLFTSYGIFLGDMVFLLIAFMIAWRGIDNYYKDTDVSGKEIKL
jgi:hypothetical protein